MNGEKEMTEEQSLINELDAAREAYLSSGVESSADALLAYHTTLAMAYPAIRTGLLTIQSLRTELEEARKERDEADERWRWERSHGCPHWGHHTSDGRDRVCWYGGPETFKSAEQSLQSEREAREKAERERDKVRADEATIVRNYETAVENWKQRAEQAESTARREGTMARSTSTSEYSFVSVTLP